MAAYYLYRETPLHGWEILCQRPVLGPADGELIELDVQWYGQAIAERDRRNGKQGAEQGALPL